MASNTSKLNGTRNHAVLGLQTIKAMRPRKNIQIIGTPLDCLKVSSKSDGFEARKAAAEAAERSAVTASIARRPCADRMIEKTGLCSLRGLLQIAELSFSSNHIKVPAYHRERSLA